MFEAVFPGVGVVHSCDFRYRDSSQSVLAKQQTTSQLKILLFLVYAVMFVEYLIRLRYLVALTLQIFVEYTGGVIINGLVVILDNGESVGIMNVLPFRLQDSICPTVDSQLPHA